MENAPHFRSIEEMDKLIENVAMENGMKAIEIQSDLAAAVMEGASEPEEAYLEEVAELSGVSIEELRNYALRQLEKLNDESEI